MSNLEQDYPAISDLRARARRRIPRSILAFLEGGTGDDQSVQRNLDGLANVTLVPRLLKGKLEPKIDTTLLGQSYNAPFGVAPVGLSGAIWPQAECLLAKTAAKYRIPYTLSTLAGETPETVGPLAGDMGWFQLYPPRDLHIREDLLKRVKDNGFRVMVVTADVPMPSRRESMARAGLKMPPVISPDFVLQAALCPAWTVATLQAGLPRLKTMEKYANSTQLSDLLPFVAQHIGGALSWDYLKELRDLWQGPLVVKGLLHPADAERALAIGVEGIQVSNHGGRQFNGTPAAIDSLPAIVAVAKGRAVVLFDSGVRSGLDIMRALALGADFVLLGRAFQYGVAAFGQTGGDLAAEILIADLKNNMSQTGCESLAEIRGMR
ncbi:MAG: alpha-hydroxy-acid oxidizing protein [Deltaproteobacteria bacterium]|nr:alpha-hydroxy-acid oxidizing protein [Deltaproteobacteria bacterium]